MRCIFLWLRVAMLWKWSRHDGSDEEIQGKLFSKRTYLLPRGPCEVKGGKEIKVAMWRCQRELRKLGPLQRLFMGSTIGIGHTRQI